MPGVTFAGIYDKNPTRAAEVAKQLDTVAHPSLDALLQHVDAVTVAVPTPVHTEVGVAVLDRGIALLMEKDRKSTRLNSSHMSISYAVFCLKKKKTNQNNMTRTE